MKLLEHFPFRPKSVSYNWDEWFDGKVREFEKGKDFACSPTSFRGCAQLAARRRGGHAKTSMTDNGVVIQFIKRESS